MTSRSKAVLQRCPWPGMDDPIYQRYHDEEWGVPTVDDNALFEKLVLEGFQSGLSWLTILKKRDNFRTAFHGFDPARIARFGANDVAKLMANAGIVRNKMKIEATITNARAFLALREETSLSALIWGIAREQKITQQARRSFADVPAVTAASRQISKALKARGFCFIGPTTMYALMQSAGMVNDHLVTCHRHKPCAALQHAFKPAKIR